jgi:hypothetical protein
MKVLFLVFREVCTSRQVTEEVGELNLGEPTCHLNLQTVKKVNPKVIFVDICEVF